MMAVTFFGFGGEDFLLGTKGSSSLSTTVNRWLLLDLAKDKRSDTDSVTEHTHLERFDWTCNHN